MRKKSGFTIVEQAVVLVPVFEKVVRMELLSVNCHEYGRQHGTLWENHWHRHNQFFKLRPLRYRETYAPMKMKMTKNRLLITIRRLSLNRKNTKTCNTSMNFIPLFIFKNHKSDNKCIALIPAGVVQHRLIAGSCRPLRVLFIMQSCFYFFLIFFLCQNALGSQVLSFYQIEFFF